MEFKEEKEKFGGVFWLTVFVIFLFMGVILVDSRTQNVDRSIDILATEVKDLWEDFKSELFIERQKQEEVALKEYNYMVKLRQELIEHKESLHYGRVE